MAFGFHKETKLQEKHIPVCCRGVCIIFLYKRQQLFSKILLGQNFLVEQPQTSQMHKILLNDCYLILILEMNNF